MQIPNHLKDPIDKFLRGQASEAEKKIVREWFQASYLDEIIVETPAGYTEEDLFARMKGKLDGMIQEDKQWPHAAEGHAAPAVHRVHFLRTSWFRIAAVFLLLLAGAWLWVRQGRRQPAAGETAQPVLTVADITPGGNKATLTLSDGRTIDLDQARAGGIAEQGSADIIKQKDGQLVYAGKAAAGSSETISYNTVTTPRGGQYQVLLPDGSKVWLNAASSIRFPTALTDTERKVVISGEAYFEIKANKNSPFRVMANGTEITVLGTKFNVNAYTDEVDVKTTLLDGKVQVKKDRYVVLPAPGQQVSTGRVSGVRAVNTASVVAWKNGFFYFSDADLKTVMRELSRWYDVDLRYEGVLPDRRFSGELQRDLRLGDVLDLMKEVNIHFKMDGRTLVLMP